MSDFYGFVIKYAVGADVLLSYVSSLIPKDTI